MPKSSELFPRKPATTGTPVSTTDTTPPKIILLDKPTATVTGGKLRISIRTLLLDEGNSSTASSIPDVVAKPKVTWVGRSPDSVSTLGEVPMKIQIRIEEPSSPPKVSWVGRSPDSVSTLGEVPMKIQIRVED